MPSSLLARSSFSFLVCVLLVIASSALVALVVLCRFRLLSLSLCTLLLHLHHLLAGGSCKQRLSLDLGSSINSCLLRLLLLRLLLLLLWWLRRILGSRSLLVLPLYLSDHFLELLLSVSLLKHVEEAALVWLSLHQSAPALPCLSLLLLESLSLFEQLLLLLRYL